MQPAVIQWQHLYDTILHNLKNPTNQFQVIPPFRKFDICEGGKDNNSTITVWIFTQSTFASFSKRNMNLQSAN